ncbi:hypothetical protein M409DRAFT_27525 [Zasmidium cellare ATCC 36951]|uniref:Increased recombination centers protein 6 n=1 Tax=Zasmidium cellare ATCC 36951 TaxID=1080233 RepID=A0A6A6C8D1_ZASCE|nr:uncharacterized protein M409DRAFT_27525 [Zasmidium cellare ATCC 36951]KAF2162142.1 hypothetical protein M409DRAFT_27525 [Zasmidium cellare ATCC 36951]
MDIKHSRRILLLGTREAGALDIVKDLTGTAPSPDINGSTAGLTHEWDVQTQYYTAKVPIWVDEVPDIESWKTEFLKDEAKEVVDAVGAWIFCFETPKDGTISEDVESAMKGIQEVVERHGTFGSEVVFLAVAKPKGKPEKGGKTVQEEQEDKCMEYGFEYIRYGATGKNEFGEKVGFERLKEALEANEWGAAGDEDDELDLDDLDFDIDDDDEMGGFGREEAEMTAELFGMKAALNREDDEDEFDPAAEDFISSSSTQQQAEQVEDLNRMMGKLMAVKEQSEGLPEAQRKRMAAKAVRDIMKENLDV